MSRFSFRGYYRYLVVVAAIISYGQGLGAQHEEFRFRQIPAEKGLPSQVVTSIVRDQQGFMWFSTKDGLCRYDGYRFKVYQHSPTNPNSISHNHAFALDVDSKGNLWIATEGGGVSKLDPKTEEFAQFLADPDNENSIPSNEALAVTVLRDDRVCFGLRSGGMSMYDPQSGSFTNFHHEEGDSTTIGDGQVWSIYEDRDGMIWCSTWGTGSCVLDPKTGKFRNHYSDPDDATKLNDALPGEMEEDSDGNLWMTTWGGGLHKYDRQTGEFSNFKIPEADSTYVEGVNDQWPIEIDGNDVLWVGTYGAGLLAFDTKSNQFIHHFDEREIGYQQIWSMLIDKTGIIWIGFDGGGVTKCLPNLKTFEHYTSNERNPWSLTTKVVKGFLVDSKERLWVSTWEMNGLHRFDKATGRFHHFDPHYNKVVSLKDAETFVKDKFGPIVEREDGLFWIGTYRGGAYLFDPDKEKFVTNYRPVEGDETSLSHKYVTSITYDRKGDLWIGTFVGLNKYDSESDNFQRFLSGAGKEGDLSNDEVHQVYSDSKGRLWVATADGLNLFDYNTQQFKVYRNDPTDSKSLPHSSITCVYEDKDGVIWVGTKEGFARMEGETFQSFGRKDGLINSQVKGLLGDDEGNLWISTNFGLVKFRVSDGKFFDYDIRDGIQGYQYEIGSFYKAADGKLFFGGSNGFNSFYPENIKDNPWIPPLAITSFRVRNEEYDVGKSISNVDRVELTYQQNDISFDFAALNFMIPEKNKYYYMLEGYDEDWVYSSIRNNATFTNLDPGTYIFKVRGSNNDNKWNNEGVSVTVVIHPPFWETNWFYFGQTLFFILLFGIAVYVNRSKPTTALAQVLAFLCLFMLFNYIFVLVSPYFDKLSQGAAIFKVLLNLVLALLILPIQKLLEKRVIKKEG